MATTPHTVTPNPAGSTNFDDMAVGELLSADAINKIKNNGVIQLADYASLQALNSTSIKVAYVGPDESEDSLANSLYFRGALGAWTKLGGGTELNFDEAVDAIIQLQTDVNDLQTEINALEVDVANKTPIGTIILWYGSLATVNALRAKGWFECNGRDGTPDFRGRVPVHANNGARGTEGFDGHGTSVAVGGLTGTTSHSQKLVKEQVGLWSHYHNHKPSSGHNYLWRGRVQYEGANTHAHLIPVRAKNLKGDSNATVKYVYDSNRSTSGVTDGMGAIYPKKSPYNSYYIHDHTFYMESNGASVTKNLVTSTIQRTLGVFYLQYKGVG